MNTSTLGSQTEAIILAELVKRGRKVLIPFGGYHRYDYVIDIGERFLKAQCKTGRIRNGKLVFDTSSRDKTWATKKVVSKGYTGEADIFLVYCPDNKKTYWVPVDAVPIGKANLRIDLPKNNQQTGIKWAKIYELPEIY